MKRHIFLTGEIQIGKSTAIRRFLESSGIHADGFLTRFDSRGEERKLYLCRYDTKLGESDTELAVIMNGHSPELIIETFNIHGAAIIRTAGSSGLIIMDELGVFEESAPQFKAAVFEKLDGGVPVLGVVKKKDSPFLDAVRVHPNVEVIEVTEDNRDAVPGLIAELIKGRL